jgi:predicted outer membrane repeat protein
MTPTRSSARPFARALGSVAALALSFGGAVGALALVAGPASADTITVTNTADDGSASSLRGVLENVNNGDVVVLTAGATYQLTLCEQIIKTSSVGALFVDGSVTIEGNGATIEQTCPDRVMHTQSEITLENVTLTGGNVDGPGGGLFQDSDNHTTLTGVTITGNTATEGGGGLATSGDLDITGSTFSDNHDTGNDGGGVRVFAAQGTTNITGSTFTGNSTVGWGGAWEQQGEELSATVTGVYELNVTTSNIVDNSANGDGGGGLDTEDDATITIDHSTLSGNQGGWGGAVGAFGAATTFSANASTFSGNTSPRDGGAVHLSGDSTPTAAATSPTTAAFVNSTITRNTEGAFGALGVEGAVTLNQVTMTHNTSQGQVESGGAASGRGGNVGALAVEGDAANIAALELSSRNSVVAQPVGAANCTQFDTPTTDGGYNFSDDDSCGFTASTSNVKTPNDPMLGTLADNGGPTETLLPLTGSPLLDAIPPASCGANVDQRGITRPQGTGCDIGAVEVVVEAPPTPAAAVVITPKFTG